MADEPTEMNNDLESRLLSARNTISLGLLALYANEHDLIPTAIEDAFYKMQVLLDHCIEEEPAVVYSTMGNGI